MHHFSRRPESNEYDGYYATYVDAVPVGDIVGQLRSQLDSGLAFLAEIPAELQDHRYAPGKWTVREAVGHVVDTERVFAYRALCIARGDTASLPGMDADSYVAGSRLAERPWQSLVDEYRHQRLANLALFSSFAAADLDRLGTASGLGVTARALLWILAGHELHHWRILRERYLDGAADSPAFRH